MHQFTPKIALELAFSVFSAVVLRFTVICL